MVDEIVLQVKRMLVAVGGATAAALTLNQWVALLTCVYVVLQALYLARKWWREEKDWRRGKGKRSGVL